MFPKVIHTPGNRQNVEYPFLPGLRTALFSFIIEKKGKRGLAVVEDHMEALIELLQKTIEQKDGQIEELRGTIMQLQATIANLNETIEEFRRKFFGSSSEKTTGRMIRHRKRQRPENSGPQPYPGTQTQVQEGGPLCQFAGQGSPLSPAGRRPALP